MNEKITPWYPGSEKPVYIGTYERQYDDGIYRDYWTGSTWRSDIGYIRIEISQHLPWRGLASPPQIK